MQIVIKESLSQFNLNQLISEARGNKYASALSKKRAMRGLYLQIKSQIKEKMVGRYAVDACWQVPNLNRDLDNMLLKSILDCMQNNGLLANDNLNHIIQITHGYEINKEYQGVILQFDEIS